MPLARNFLDGPEVVEVYRFGQMAEHLGCISYFKEINGKMERMDDIVEVPNNGVMDMLRSSNEKRIVATVIPFESDSGHPQVNSAIIEGKQPVHEETV